MSSTLTPAKSGRTEPLPVQWVERLFQKLLARYGTLLTDRFAGVPRELLLAEWADELAGYSGAELATGLDGCRALKFPPTLPEFMALCRPPIEPAAAYHEALRNLREREQGGNPAWSHRAVYWAAVDVGHWDLRSQTYVAVRSRWERALSDELRKGHWPPIPPAPKQLPAPAIKANPHTVAMVRELAKRLRVNATEKHQPKESA